MIARSAFGSRTRWLRIGDWRPAFPARPAMRPPPRNRLARAQATSAALNAQEGRYARAENGSYRRTIVGRMLGGRRFATIYPARQNRLRKAKSWTPGSALKGHLVFDAINSASTEARTLTCCARRYAQGCAEQSFDQYARPRRHQQTSLTGEYDPVLLSVDDARYPCQRSSQIARAGAVHQPRAAPTGGRRARTRYQTSPFGVSASRVARGVEGAASPRRRLDSRKPHRRDLIRPDQGAYLMLETPWHNGQPSGRGRQSRRHHPHRIDTIPERWKARSSPGFPPFSEPDPLGFSFIESAVSRGSRLHVARVHGPNPSCGWTAPRQRTLLPPTSRA
jgi:hypothetical protein